MARLRASDPLQNHRFWLFDTTPSWSAFPYMVLNPLMGFQSIAAPQVDLETQEIAQMNSPWKRYTYTGASAQQISVARAVTCYDSSFYRWVRQCLIGGKDLHRTLMLLQYMGWNPTGLVVKNDIARAAILGGAAIAGDAIGAVGALGQQFGGLVPIVAGATIGLIPGKMWMLHECLPISYKGTGDLEASSAEVSISELTLQPVAIEEIGL